ncbi:MAG: hypothetical protein NTZ56_14565 [Acidobacteria bacterium]|nr:hypothetical protein [Acidobacteriota bacterium]
MKTAKPKQRPTGPATSTVKSDARALEKLLTEMDDKEITRRLNQVYAKVDSRLDPGFARLQWETLKRQPW